MKENPKKNYNFYVWIGGLIIVIILVVYLMIAIIGSIKNVDLKGDLGVKLEDNKIASGEETYLIVKARNTGTELLEGEFKIQADDTGSVQVTYPNTEMLKFKLYPEESIERRIGITGTSKAIRTDYELDVVILGSNETVITKETIVLTVTNE